MAAQGQTVPKAPPRRYWAIGLGVWLLLVGAGAAGLISRGVGLVASALEEPEPPAEPASAARPGFNPMNAGLAQMTGQGVAFGDDGLEVPEAFAGAPGTAPPGTDDAEEDGEPEDAPAPDAPPAPASPPPPVAPAVAPPAPAPAPAAPPPPVLTAAIPPLPAPQPPSATAPAPPPPAPEAPVGPAARDLARALAAALHEAEGVGRDAGAISHAVANLENRLRKFSALLSQYRSAARPAGEAARAREFAQKADRVGSRLLRAAAEYKAAANRLAAPSDLEDPLGPAQKLLEEAGAALEALEAEAARAP